MYTLEQKTNVRVLNVIRNFFRTKRGHVVYSPHFFLLLQMRRLLNPVAHMGYLKTWPEL